MQNLVPDAMKLNKFQHVEIPQNNVLYLRTVGKSIPQGPSEVQTADFFSRTLDQHVQQEQDFYDEYAKQANQQEQQSEQEPQSDQSDCDEQE